MKKNKTHIESEVQKTMDSIDEIQRVDGNPFLYTRLQEQLKQQNESSDYKKRSRIPVFQITMVAILLLSNIFVLNQTGYFDSESTSIDDFANEYTLNESEEDLDYLSTND